ncbi:MAG TPA: hypothetical protein VK387_09845 [Thermoleophilaceae bacterium]|nr:hypothetical protein [Thermoleophilaceae bacterium]
MQRADRFIEARKGPGKPFFLYVADYIPHNEHPPADRHAHLPGKLFMEHIEEVSDRAKCSP